VFIDTEKLHPKKTVAILLKMTTHINAQKLKKIINEKDWDQLLQNVKPKHFVRQESEYVGNNNVCRENCQLTDNCIK